MAIRQSYLNYLNKQLSGGIYSGGELIKLDLTPGSTINAATLVPFAYLTDILEQRISDMEQTYLSTHPDDFDGSRVDLIASNFLINRANAETGVAVIRLIVSEKADISLPAGDTFTSEGVVYTVAATTTISKNALLPNREYGDFYSTPDIRVNFSFTGSYTESTVDLSNYTELAYPNSQTVAGFKKALLYGVIISASASETSSKLLSRLVNAMSARSMANKSGISYRLGESFPGVPVLDVIGSENDLVVRDKLDININQSHPVIYNFRGKTAETTDILHRTFDGNFISDSTNHYKLVPVETLITSLEEISTDNYAKLAYLNLTPSDCYGTGEGYVIKNSIKSSTTSGYKLSFITDLVKNWSIHDSSNTAQNKKPINSGDVVFDPTTGDIEIGNPLSTMDILTYLKLIVGDKTTEEILALPDFTINTGNTIYDKTDQTA